VSSYSTRSQFYAILGGGEVEVLEVTKDYVIINGEKIYFEEQLHGSESTQD